jgi:ubiquinone/menaquinone biosynthesis C-methylase UbiE
VTPANEFDAYADEYDATVLAAIGASGESVAYFAELKARLARHEAPTADRVLDFGCGVGNMSRALLAQYPRAKVTGCDPSADSIAVARKRSGSAIEFATSSDRLPFPDGSFDLVVAACVFHHIASGERAHWAGEIARVLRRGGRYAHFEHNPFNPLTQRVVRNVPFDAGVELLRCSESVRLLEAAGLRVKRERYYFFFPRFLAPLRTLEPIMGWIPMGGQYYVIGERS